MDVTAHVRLASVEGRKLLFEVEVRDSSEIISTGTHERFVIDSAKFRTKIAQKAEIALAHLPAAEPP
jgi:fluoroacetyl-CoA thioesterase